MNHWSDGCGLLRSFSVCLVAVGLAYLISFVLNRVNGDVKVFDPVSDLFPGSEEVVAEPAPSLNVDLSPIEPEGTSIATDSIHSSSAEVDPIVAEVDSTDSSSMLMDYTPDHDGVSRVRAWLQEAREMPLHVAFFSDSFTEGDLLVADFRRMLQQTFGGKGVGYLPVTSATARFRTSVRHRFGGAWAPHTLLQAGSYTASGQCDHLSGEGQVTIGISSPTSSSKEVDRVALLYRCGGSAILTTTVNDTVVSRYDLSATEDGRLSLWEERGGGVRSIRMEVQSDDLDVHGIFLDGATGVSVDNMSRRGASGGELTRISGPLCSEMRGVRNYRLIILSFGLNALSLEDEADDYFWYYHKMKKSLAHIRELFPDAVVLLMSVSDRATIVDGKVVTLRGVRQVRAIQKRLARENGCLFWDTFAAMQELGGVQSLVEKGRMAKDYTHLSVSGGRELAKRLYHSLVEE